MQNQIETERHTERKRDRGTRDSIYDRNESRERGQARSEQRGDERQERGRACAKVGSMHDRHSFGQNAAANSYLKGTKRRFIYIHLSEALGMYG